MRRSIAAAAMALGLMMSLAGCPNDGGDGGDARSGDTAAPEDSQDTGTDGGAADVSDGQDSNDSSGPDAGDTTSDSLDDDAVALTEPGEFLPGTADLPDEHVFKGVWAGEAGRIVAVGNRGVIASKLPASGWNVLAQVEGAELLNAVTGVSGERLFTVGKNGAILVGSVASFGDSAACSGSAECDDQDVCTVDLCVAGSCQAQPSGLAGCCGSEVARWNFDSGMAGWGNSEVSGSLSWSAVEATNRATSGRQALYFGDPAADPPTYDTGAQAAATAVSPPVSLPASGAATLSFEIWADTEADSGFDTFYVEVQVGPDRFQVWHKSALPIVPTNGFVHVEVDLSYWAGETVQLRFRFDSLDGTFNAFEGVYVDDVVIDSECTAGEADKFDGPTLWGAWATSEDAVVAVGQGGTIMQYDGARWRAAAGSDNSSVWNDIAGVGQNLAFVGNSGAVSVALGGALTVVDTGVSWNLHGVATGDGQTFWAVGDKGTVLKGQGSSWATVEAPTAASLRDVVVSGSDVWVVGFSGVLLRYDGTIWHTEQSGVSDDLYGVAADDNGLITAVGADGQVIQGAAGATFLSYGTLHPGGELAAVWVNPDSSAIFAVGSGGRVVAFDGQSWSAMTSGTSQSLSGIWGVSATDLWATGRAGTLLSWDGQAWTRAESPSTASLNAVWGTASDQAWAVGSGGALLAYNGMAWSNLISTTTVNLRAAFALAANDIWAVGAGGTIMHNGGLGWGASVVAGTAMSDGSEEPITDELHAVWAAAEDDAWAVGSAGRVLRWDGSQWADFETEFDVTLRGIYGIAANDIWAVGNAGHAIHFNGELWERVETGSIATLHAIHGDGQDHVVVVGGLGTVLTLSR